VEAPPGGASNLKAPYSHIERLILRRVYPPTHAYDPGERLHLIASERLDLPI
jgi:hypothetical protein